MAHLLKSMEFEDLMNQTDPEADQPSVQQVPVTIHAYNGMFVADEVAAWAYMEQGVFAIGRWTTDSPDTERHVLIPYNRIQYLEFDYVALERYEAAQQKGDE